MISFNKMFSAEEIAKGIKPHWTRYLWYAVGIGVISCIFWFSVSVCWMNGYAEGHKVGMAYYKSLCDQK